MAKNINYWLIKSEPSAYSIDDMEKNHQEHWDGIRNYQARNFLRDTLKIGDIAIFYHSSTNPPGAAGVVQVCKEGYPDFTAWDPKCKTFDPKTKKEDPTWYMVDFEFVEKFSTYVPLSQIRETPGLEDMTLIKKGVRLSIQPIKKNEFDIISKLGQG